MAMSDLHKGFQGTIVNRALPFLNGGSLEIMLTVPLSEMGLYMQCTVHNCSFLMPIPRDMRIQRSSKG